MPDALSQPMSGQCDVNVPLPPSARLGYVRGPLGSLRLSVWRIIVGTVSVEVHPVTADRWNDLVTVFGRRGKDPSWDWCQLFVRTSEADAAGPVNNRTALE